MNVRPQLTNIIFDGRVCLECYQSWVATELCPGPPAIVHVHAYCLMLVRTENGMVPSHNAHARTTSTNCTRISWALGRHGPQVHNGMPALLLLGTLNPVARCW